jgi:transcriptional regulator
MHPNRAFEWTDRAEILGFVRATAFAHIFSSGESGLAVVHVPVLVTRAGTIQFHVARRNRAAPQLHGNRLLLSITGRESYQSANWYVSENQVPTWHYEAVEIEGVARTLTDDELVVLLDNLSAEMEERYSQEHPWTRAKMQPGSFEAMTKAIVGFEVVPDAIRATRKFNQHKSAEDRAATAAGLRGVGLGEIAEAVEQLGSGLREQLNDR